MRYALIAMPKRSIAANRGTETGDYAEPVRRLTPAT